MESYADYIKSHLLQMRGLKPEPLLRYIKALKVASFTDAWIETLIKDLKGEKSSSHLLQMRGLKQNGMVCLEDIFESHLLQMRGLKRYCSSIHASFKVASFTDAWIETGKK